MHIRLIIFGIMMILFLGCATDGDDTPPDDDLLVTDPDDPAAGDDDDDYGDDDDDFGDDDDDYGDDDDDWSDDPADGDDFDDGDFDGGDPADGTLTDVDDSECIDGMDAFGNDCIDDGDIEPATLVDQGDALDPMYTDPGYTDTVEPQPAPFDNNGAPPMPVDQANLYMDCAEIGNGLTAGYVRYGCRVMNNNGQHYGVAIGWWRINRVDGVRARAANLNFREGGYDVTFDVIREDAASGITLSPARGEAPPRS